MQRIIKLTSLLLILILLIPQVIFAANDTITLYIDNQKITCDVPPEIVNGRTLVPVRVIFEHFDAKVYWNDTVKQVTIATNDKTILLTINSNTAVVNAQRHLLDAAPVIKEGRTLIPVRFISETLGYEVSWEEKTRSVKIMSSTPNTEVPDIDTDKKPEYEISKTTVKSNKTNDVVTISTNCEEKPYMMVLASPYRLVFDFDNTLLSDGDGKISADTGYIAEIRYAQHDSSARVVIECNGTQPYKALFKNGVVTVEVGDEDSYIEDSGPVLDDNQDDADYVPEDTDDNNDNDTTDDENSDNNEDSSDNNSSGDDENTSDTEDSESPLTALEFLAKRDPDNLVVILDAGHGGSDPGAIGYDPDGNIVIKEKDANLTITNKVAAILKERGIKFKQTRSTDVYLTLPEITDFANNADADLFVSIHNNAVEDTSVSGMMVLYNGEGSGTYGIDGKTIATYIKNEIVDNVDILDRGIISRPGLWVLRKSIMPAVLIECAFVTNENDRNLLLDDEVLDMYAVSIADGIEKSLQVMQKSILAARETLSKLENKTSLSNQDY